MRARKTAKGLTVQGIAGTNVVLLAMNLKAHACQGLRGFAIHRTDHTENEAYWLSGTKTFAATDPGAPAGTKQSTRKHPVQDFMWSDYTAKPGHEYTFRVLALKGPVDDLQPSAEVSVDLRTEDPADGDHDVYFNRGAAASQQYAKEFGNRKPGTKGGDADPAWAWLSRGAHEAILEFIGRAKSKTWGLRVCAYEFHLPSVVEALHEARAGRKADVRILYDAGKEPPRDANRKAVAAAHIQGLCTERVPKPLALSHNKFIVLLKSGKPVAVLTGSTNFSQGGVFGHSNVVHVVEDPKIAADYLAVWDELEKNPAGADLRSALTAAHPLPAALPAKGTSTIFSPRGDKLKALEYYARLAATAKGALFMTFAFGMNKLFEPAYAVGTAPLRYALFETLLGPGVKKADRPAAEQKMIALRKQPENLFAVGSRISLNALDRWLGEKLSGLNSHVKYIHTKYMLLDPLGPDPIVITGSANFSAASTNQNDENMLLIRGNARVADIYLGEFMRLWDHYAFRGWVESQRAKKKPLDEVKHLDDTDAWWKRHFGNTPQSRVREYFAG